MLHIQQWNYVPYSVPGLIVGGVSEGHLDGGGWEGGVVLWFYKVALKEDETNIVRAWLTHAAQVLMRMAGTVEVPDCSGLACTRSCLTLCLAPCPHLSSVGEVRSGPVPGHFCWTGDRTVWSLTKFLGPGPGTATDHLYRSGPGPDRVQTVPALFIYLFIQD